MPLSREEPEEDFAPSSGILRENSAFPFPAKSSFLFSQDEMPKTVRGIRKPYKNLINAFIIPILNSTNKQVISHLQANSMPKKEGYASCASHAGHAG
jgi:hypothetical protein